MIPVVISLCFCILLSHVFPLEEEVKPGILQVTYGRIINGENATLGQFPWQVGVDLGFNDTIWFCGGSIISEYWILTAAHCLDRAELAYVYVGTVDLVMVPEVILSSEFILHEEYNANTLANDIGLIKLRVNLSFNTIIAPIALASEPLEGGEEVVVSGFGVTADGEDGVNPFLNYITVTTITNSECMEIYGNAILDNMVCTSAGADPVKGACIGDTEGPAVLNADTDPLHVGIASFVGQTGCKNGNPSGFTRTAYYREWIKENTGV
ncbi:brachyurin-like [Zophobas morio]|uniref:brachyurin-like n=1 Tax=Zophobas morio TaxID=2755281 RepID=UPI0030834ADC